jgi:K(+)-stimulated pyrophosphate-energized sodium pump
MLIGGALPWLFSSFAIQAVSRAASLIVLEVRRQFKLGVLEGKVKPDYKQAVAISTTAAQKELVSLALLGIVTPIVVGLTLQVEALGGFLAGIIVSGQLLAVFLNNSGGAWDNAKKLIEDEPKDLQKNTGKGSERHKAGVVGDTVGDPFKDTAGPALNPMIKVVNLVSVIIAPIVVQYSGAAGSTVIVVWVVALALLGLLLGSHLRLKLLHLPCWKRQQRQLWVAVEALIQIGCTQEPGLTAPVFNRNLINATSFPLHPLFVYFRVASSTQLHRLDCCFP